MPTAIRAPGARVYGASGPRARTEGLGIATCRPGPSAARFGRAGSGPGPRLRLGGRPIPLAPVGAMEQPTTQQGRAAYVNGKADGAAEGIH